MSTHSPSRPRHRDREAPRGDRRQVLRRWAERAAVAGVGVAVVLAVLAPQYSYNLGLVLVVPLVLLRLPRVQLDGLTWSLAALVLLHALSMTWSVDPDQTAVVASMLAVSAVYVVAIRLAADSPRALLSLSAVLLASSVLAVAFVALVAVRDLGASSLLRPAVSVTIPGINPNYLGYTFATALFALAVLLQRRTSRPGSRRRRRTVLARRAVIVAVAMLLMWGAYLAGTQGALAAGALVLVWVVLCRFVPPSRLARPLCVVVVIVSVAVTTGLLDGLIGRVLGEGDNSAAAGLSGRLTIWPAARAYAADSPFIGWGPGTYELSGPWRIGAHNAFLETAGGLGLLGLACFVLVLVSAMKLWPHVSNPAILARGTLVCALTPILLSGYWTTSMPFYISLALAAQCSLLVRPGVPAATAADARSPEVAA